MAVWADGVIRGVMDEQGRALLRVKCFVSEKAQRRLELSKKLIPAPLVVIGLVDTGCTGMMVSPSVRERLGIQQVNVLSYMSSSGTAEAEFFPLGYSILSSDDKEVVKRPNVEVGVLGWEPREYSVLIGWDVLQHVRLNYDGPQKRFTLHS